MTKERDEGFQHIGQMALIENFLKPQKPPTKIQQRLLDAAAIPDEQHDHLKEILYQHSALCQTFLPYRDPGDDARTWERLNGNTHLKVYAGEAMHPELSRLVLVGLPFGPKARMVLMHINQQALIARCPEIEVDASLTKFVRRTLKLDTDGRTIRVVKDQLSRLAASRMVLGIVHEGKATTFKADIITDFDIWLQKDERQRVLWPSTIKLSLDYWESLKAHAVPLPEYAIAALSHSAMALDIYAWLAQRLHRVPWGKPAFIPWPYLHDIFGANYTRLRKFREVYTDTLKQVAEVYREAKFDTNEKGMTLKNSPPPVPYRLQIANRAR